MFTLILLKLCWTWWQRHSRRVAQLGILLFVAGASGLHAQTATQPAKASASADKAPPGFTPGWTGGLDFEGSASSDGDILDLGFATGYNFSRHFGMGLEVPYYFIGTPSSIKVKNPNAVSGNGLGSVTTELRWNYLGRMVNYASSVTVGAPTGDKKKGLSTGHATWNSSNHIEHAWESFTPFLDAGVGNSIADTWYFHRPFMTFGYNAAFQGGANFDAGPLTFTASAYDVAPWGDQTVFSRVFRCPSGTKCSASGTTTDRRSYKSASVVTGGASLTRDNGFSAGASLSVVRSLDLQAGFTHSVPLGLDMFSFGISWDIAAAAHPKPSH